MRTRRVVITGVGAVTPFGLGANAFADGLRLGKNAVRPAQGIDTSDLRSSCVGEVDDAFLSGAGVDVQNDRCLAMATLAADEAVAHANLQSGDFADERTVVALGTACGEVRNSEQILRSGVDHRNIENLPTVPSFITTRIALRLGLGPLRRCFTFLSACTAASQAIAHSSDLIRMGEASLAIAGGSDILSRWTLSGFNSLHALAPIACRPFDENREGTQLAEGAVFFVLEERDHAESRHALPLAEITGYGSSSDAFHPTRSDPEGTGPRAAMAGALKDAGLSPRDIDYINAHGTATFQNDMIELAAIRSVFGPTASSIPISSTKSQVGHTAGACGALELLATMYAVKEQMLPMPLAVPITPPLFWATGRPVMR